MASRHTVTRLLLGAAAIAVTGTAWAGATWYRNNSDAMAVESELTSVIGQTQGREGDPAIRTAAREHAGDLRARMNALSDRLFVNEERVKNLLVKIDWLEARLVHAEAVAAFERCNAEVAGYQTEVEGTIASCEGERSKNAQCKAAFESDRSTTTEEVGVGCGLGAAALAFFTGGLGAGALALCAGATVAAHELPEDHCGPAPTCVTDRNQITTSVLRSRGLAAMRVCTPPGASPPDNAEEFLAWRTDASAQASL